jgi:predicted enzyme related to lactoylglutathione lyase
MNMPALPKQLLNKRIPTILGMIVLVVALIAGILFLGDGPGVFAPRATPETTPQRIRLTNVTDNSFTVSFLTDEATPGFIRYGESPDSVRSQASDDRDQLTGSVGSFQTHHITVRGLKESTEYYYVLGTGSGSTFDNNGQPFNIRTAARTGAPSAAKTIHGSVSNETGTPADGAIVYITMENAGEMSTLVRSSGGWAIPLSNARTPDGSAYAQISDNDGILITVQGLRADLTISLESIVSQAQPVPTLTFGQVPVSQVIQPGVPEASDVQELDDELEEELDDFLSELEEETEEFVDISQRASLLEGALEEEAFTPTQTIVDLEKEDEEQAVDTNQPKIIGKAAPNVVVTIEVNSEHQIIQEVTADENGNFELDLSALAADLEPGEHTVRYSYTDPDTGQLVEKVVTFTVLDTSQQLASAPFGTASPFPTPLATPIQVSEATASAEATESAVATPEARVDMPSTAEGVPVSGSVGTTLALVFGGLFFIISGVWSFWISHQLREEI